jgi:hypothetical protein
VSCGGPQEILEIKEFHLKEVDPALDESEVVRGEELKRLYGAVTPAERRDRLGHYYTMGWNGPAGREREPVRMVFEYRQAATGSKILRMEQSFEGTAKGTAEFHVKGPAYHEGGRVLAWRLSMYRGAELVETKRSYMWR